MLRVASLLVTAALLQAAPAPNDARLQWIANPRTTSGSWVADAALLLHRRWGVGKRQRDNGIVFLLEGGGAGRSY